MRVEAMPAPPPEQQPMLPVMGAHKIDPMTGEDEMAMAMAMAGGPAAARQNIIRAMAGNAGASLASAEAGAALAQPRNPNDPSSWGKVGRNEACPCGSGKNFKHCHGRYGSASSLRGARG